MKRLSLRLIVALVPAALFTACAPTLGPGEAFYTYHNQQNSFAQIQVDGRITGPTYRPDESRKIPLLMAEPHTIIVSHGSYTTVLSGRGNFIEEYVIDVTDSPYTIRWSDPEGWMIQNGARP